MDTSFSGPVGWVAWAVLLAGFGYASYTDWRTREAPDGVWWVLGLGGALLGSLAAYPEGAVALLSWWLVAGLIVQHFVGWDRPVERLHEALPGYAELLAYVLVGAVVAYLAVRFGVGAVGVPWFVVAAYAVVVLARLLFETGLLYGGADAKALMAAAALVPLAPPVVASVPANEVAIAAVLPGPISLLMNAALLSAAVPIGLAVRNALRHEFSFPQGFVGYSLPVRELPDHYVWIHDPLLGASTEEEEEVESSEDDRALRTRQRAELEAKGVERVWVTPQLPFLVFFFAGALAMLLAGNLLFDLLALL